MIFRSCTLSLQFFLSLSILMASARAAVEPPPPEVGDARHFFSNVEIDDLPLDEIRRFSQLSDVRKPAELKSRHGVFVVSLSAQNIEADWKTDGALADVRYTNGYIRNHSDLSRWFPMIQERLYSPDERSAFFTTGMYFLRDAANAELRLSPNYYTFFPRYSTEHTLVVSEGTHPFTFVAAMARSAVFAELLKRRMERVPNFDK